ncbi:right-handed parallel beta-helix repeat-containing protein [Paenibacillus sp. HB172176]|uniref:right-handed parallel beta-helix repeat-containing protein n=1 Tax=Paenibacillus sp. HB172176 TaxID=2493690 RepID=UPI00143C043F|nr:right-handed parallel beta-helix repeat-containing protein [Paenibacillus sp. HB172176]
MAIIDVYPGGKTAIQDAVSAANEGDVLLVHRGVYCENVQISGAKNNIRILAKERHRAVLSGNSSLSEAFALKGVAGVVIEGFRISSYRSSGIRVCRGKSNRILHNEIEAIDGEKQPMGIVIKHSVGNLIMRNTIEQIGSASSDVLSGRGIGLRGGMGNWIVQNKLQHNASHGIEILVSHHNAIAGNRISRNKGNGIVIRRSDNNLILENQLHNNGRNGFHAQSTNNYILNGSAQGNHGNGLLLDSNYNLAGFNHIQANEQSGMIVISDFNDMLENAVARNNKNGIWIQAPHTANLVFENRLQHNRPQNLKDDGVNNNSIQNE